MTVSRIEVALVSIAADTDENTATKCQGIPRCMMGHRWNGVKCHCGCCAPINNQRGWSMRDNEKRLASWLKALPFLLSQMLALAATFHFQPLTSQNLFNYHDWTIKPTKDPTSDFALNKLTDSTVVCLDWVAPTILKSFTKFVCSY